MGKCFGPPQICAYETCHILRHCAHDTPCQTGSGRVGECFFHACRMEGRCLLLGATVPKPDPEAPTTRSVRVKKDGTIELKGFEACTITSGPDGEGGHIIIMLENK